MAPISFALSSENMESHLERKPPVAPRKSPRNSCSEDDVGFIGKLTKFEMLARQSRNCVSPKVFPVGALTINVPADQILGHSRSSSLISLSKCQNSPLQNLTNFDRSRSNTPCQSNGQSHLDERFQLSECRTPSRSTTPNNSYHTSTPNDNQMQMCTETYMKSCSPHCYENNNENHGTQSLIMTKMQPNSYDVMSRSMTCQRPSDFDKYEREFDMSQSLIMTKTTTTEFLHIDKLRPSSSNRGSNGFTDMEFRSGNFGSNPNIKRIQPPSPAFNRNPKYSEQKRRCGRDKSPTPSMGSGCSLEELMERQYDAENKRREAEKKRKVVQEERLKEQEVEKQEKMRLEEILAMCAEYERQSTLERPRQPNR